MTTKVTVFAKDLAAMSIFIDLIAQDGRFTIGPIATGTFMVKGGKGGKRAMRVKGEMTNLQKVLVKMREVKTAPFELILKVTQPINTSTVSASLHKLKEKGLVSKMGDNWIITNNGAMIDINTVHQGKV